MKKNLVLVFYWLIIPFFLFAQTEKDTLPGIQDSVLPKVKPLAKDSPVLKKKTVKVLPQKVDSIPQLTDSVPPEIVMKTQAKYLEAFERLTGKPLPA